MTTLFDTKPRQAPPPAIREEDRPQPHCVSSHELYLVVQARSCERAILAACLRAARGIEGINPQLGLVVTCHAMATPDVVWDVEHALRRAGIASAPDDVGPPSRRSGELTYADE